MEYTTIYSSLDVGEISIITHLFDKKKIDYKVLDGESMNLHENDGTGHYGTRIQVVKNEFERAKTVLLEHGFLGKWNKGRSKRRQIASMPKWIFLLLAALALIIVSFLIMWFMNP